MANLSAWVVAMFAPGWWGAVTAVPLVITPVWGSRVQIPGSRVNFASSYMMKDQFFFFLSGISHGTLVNILLIWRYVLVRCAAVVVSYWSMPDNWSRERSKLNLILISVVYGRYVWVCFTTCLFCTVRWMAVSNRCVVQLLKYQRLLQMLLNHRQLLRQATGAITLE